MLKPASLQDRRQSLRVVPSPDKPVRVNINGEDFIDIFNAVDIGFGGVALNVPHGFKGCEINRQVLIIIDLPLGSKRLCAQVQGRILHLSGTKFGVSFTEMSEANRDKIRLYISQQLRRISLVNWLRFQVSQFFAP